MANLGFFGSQPNNVGTGSANAVNNTLFNGIQNTVHPTTFEPGAKQYTAADIPALQAQYPGATQPMLDTLTAPARNMGGIDPSFGLGNRFGVERDQRALLKDDNGQPFTSAYDANGGNLKFDKGYNGKDLYFKPLEGALPSLLRAAPIILGAMSGAGALAGVPMGAGLTAASRAASVGSALSGSPNAGGGSNNQQQLAAGLRALPR